MYYNHINFSTNLRLIGCGVDGESISRFLSYVGQSAPLPLVFSSREVEYINSLVEPACGFCAAFCCKEAVYKAISQPMNFIECEFLYHPEKEVQQPILSFAGDGIPKIEECRVNILQLQPDELVAVVHLFGRV